MTPYFETGDGRVRLYCGDCVDVMKALPEKSVNCCVTSPPYWGLRDYGTAKWEGGDPRCEHIEAKEKSRYDYSLATSLIQDGERKGTDAPKWKDVCPTCGAKKIDSQLGIEKTPEEYVANLVAVFREVWRVLRDDGTLWLNLGSSYAGGGRGCDTPKQQSNRGTNGMPDSIVPAGYKPKDMVPIPWLVAMALQKDGWYLRQDIIWSKPNPMPESVTDRCTKAHEYIFLLSKNAKYYYDAEAIKEPCKDSSIERLGQDIENQQGSLRVPGKTNGPMKAVAPKSWNGSEFHDGKNLSVHPNVGKNRKHDGTDHGSNGVGFQTHNGNSLNRPDGLRNKRSVWTVTTQPFKEAHFATFPPKLITPCVLAGCPIDGTVLDPFGGAGTTAIVAGLNRRNAILSDLNPAYCDIAAARIRAELRQGVLI